MIFLQKSLTRWAIWGPAEVVDRHFYLKHPSGPCACLCTAIYGGLDSLNGILRDVIVV